jgi:hypothetical protein
MAHGVNAAFLLLASSPLLLLVLQLLLVSTSCILLSRSARGEDLLTNGFTAVELAEAQFKVQKPYDVPLPERYEFVDGVRRMWVYAADHPITTAHPGGPRTETKIEVITVTLDQPRSESDIRSTTNNSFLLDSSSSPITAIDRRRWRS